MGNSPPRGAPHNWASAMNLLEVVLAYAYALAIRP